MPEDEIVLDGSSLTIEDVVEIARSGYGVSLSDDAIERIKASEALVRELVEGEETIYGVTTGIGELSRIKVSGEQSRDLQLNMIRSHAAGAGKPLGTEVVRAAMAIRVNTLAKGVSGVRIRTLETLVEMLNKDVVPVVKEKGSLGASGDLAPMAQLALVLVGEGEALYGGERLPGDEAMEGAGIETVRLESKDTLALINGTPVSAALAALHIHDARLGFLTGQVASAMAIDALRGITRAFDPRLHAVRLYEGQNVVAANLRRMLQDSELMREGSTEIQDAYSIRCTPQVLGPVHDALEYAREQVEIEINSGVDNPLFFTEEGDWVSGGNFHGQPLSAAMDFLGMVFAFAAGLAERQINRLMNPALSDLPGFLVESRGINSGLMLAQYTAAALVSECKVYSHPACVDSIPVSADKEDFVPMTPASCHTFGQILDNYRKVVAIELMAAAQALDMRDGEPGKGTGVALRTIRKDIPALKEDRVLHGDIEILEAMVRDGSILSAVEDSVERLE